MSIIEHLNKIKPWLLPINIILVGTLGFGLGRLSRIEETKLPVTIEGPIIPMASSSKPLTTASPSKIPVTRGDQVVSKKSVLLVASKNGTKYYYPTCSGASRIKEENKVWFASATEAKAAGYTPAANCPGL